VCGIAGILNTRERIDPAALARASMSMAHRGPDDEGVFLEGPVGLAHRRLSIIDLNTGSQPMFNENKTIVVVFNGEIYNYVKLRSELESKGHIFSTSSDTEVILHAYEQWNTGCVEKFHGMFAFALYDRRDRSLFLSRDRCGEKPIFYSYQGEKLCFASELLPLLALIEEKPPVDPEALYLYLRLGYIPAPRSFYVGIRKVEPGSSILFKEGNLTTWRYYMPSLPSTVMDASVNVREEELCEELDSTLTNAVKKMLVSDVPLGAFLSGGLDSSLIVALMAKVGGVPQTFSISFDEDSFDESRHASLVAQLIGTEHTHYKVALNDFDSCLSLMEGFHEPFADSSGIPTFHLARETRKKVKVALSGDGSDEVFGGYRRYLAQSFVKYYFMTPRVIRNHTIKPFLSLFPDSDKYYGESAAKTARLFIERAESSRNGSLGLMINTVFPEREISELFPDLCKNERVLQDHLKCIQSNHVEALMYADRLLYLPDDILVKVDRMSMKNSLEVRAPYLDPEVLRLSDRIPISMKVKGRALKYLLKKVALRYLPRRIVHRKKHGFMVPMSKWIRMAGEVYIREKMPAWIDSKALDSVLRPHFALKADNSQKIFALIMLGRYLDV
jgi:asparagine synthase (glutamine-hydrolysing)